MSLFSLYFSATFNWLSHQTVTEKHKLNVPETMTEVLDVSDEEGELTEQARTRLKISHFISPCGTHCSTGKRNVQILKVRVRYCEIFCVAVDVKVVYFIALRLEDEPLFEMSVKLEGTAQCLPCSVSLVWVNLRSCNSVIVFVMLIKFLLRKWTLTILFPTF